ncbi:MAG: LPS export ABC transporter periplasmic protein LptC [Pacificimonas sp.]|jgi:lipopolysaccharide export system protein LptC|nr:LPS export ABC transporter periplasmic protein LptC [Pacificimonas sp.]
MRTALAIPEVNRLTPGAARRHSRFVRHSRLALPAIAAGLVVTYALSATPPRVDVEFARQFSEVDVDSTSMRLARPRYLGEDLQGRPFEVAAQTAERNPNTPDFIALENPEAFKSIETGENAKVRAARGLMNTRDKRLDLNDDVQLDHRIGGSAFTLNTDAAAVDLQNQTVTSTVGVVGEGDRGSVAADTLTVYQDEGRSVLEGNVRLRFNTQTPAGKDQGKLR